MPLEEKEVEVIHVCKLCSKEFVMTEKHEQWYKDRGLEVPTHCPKCRAKRREDAAKLDHTSV